MLNARHVAFRDQGSWGNWRAARHEVLRSAYRQEDPTTPLRTVSRALPGGVRVCVAASEGGARVLQLMDRAVGHQLGMVGIRCCVVLASTNDSPMLGVNMHHILADADGMSLYFSELMQAAALISAGFSDDAVAEALPRRGPLTRARGRLW